MNIRAALIDFDGTLVTEDILDVVCEIVGKRAESEALNKAFLDKTITGTQSLVERVNLLKGVPIHAIEEKLYESNYTRPGARELIDYCNQNGIVTALQSRNMIPILDYYKSILGIGYVLGTEVTITDGVVQCVSGTPSLKFESCRDFLGQHSILPTEAIALGDSMGDRKVFGLVRASIAVDPKDEIGKHATATVYSDLRNAISMMEMIKRFY